MNNIASASHPPLPQPSSPKSDPERSKPSLKQSDGELLIYIKMQEFLVWLFPTLNKFPKNQRLVMAQQISNSALDSLRMILRARNAKTLRKKAVILFDLNVELEVLRKLLSTANAIGFLPNKQVYLRDDNIICVIRCGGSSVNVLWGATTDQRSQWGSS